MTSQQSVIQLFQVDSQSYFSPVSHNSLLDLTPGITPRHLYCIYVLSCNSTL